jgi:hypothetical protein
MLQYIAYMDPMGNRLRPSRNMDLIDFVGDSSPLKRPWLFHMLELLPQTPRRRAVVFRGEKPYGLPLWIGSENRS